MAAQRIDGSVGRKGVNFSADIGKVQTLLKNKGLYQGRVDSVCGPKTIAAIEKFQAHFMRSPDGLIEANGVTWKKLTGEVPMGAALPAQAAGTGTIPDFSFPLAFRPSKSWRDYGLNFGAPRGPGRRHAGCDLYAPTGTPIYAVADGVLHRPPYNFKVFTADQVQAIEVRHGNLIVRYTEIKPNSFTGIIKKGQKIAEVGRMVSPTGAVYEMLHIEIYTNANSFAALTDKNRPPYRRRADVTDPAPYLDVWVNNLPQP
ncbi:MAG: peptidoglycan DD-metalloendopeptidase family protein [Azoarcus sp.]|jgi:murein DD-endopeptidase MepM/ murein hydrolase activator NlpD|nr:peptidoglycan DD-metalloendopeptidase family protein [Azoarcus sp.]